jgi:hypothetical protein
VVEQAVEQADSGGMVSRKRPHSSKGQWEAMPRDRRS